MQEKYYQVTEWLRRHSACGPSCHQNARLNINWCEAEVKRLAKKGIKAWIETSEDDKVAVFAQAKSEGGDK